MDDYYELLGVEPDAATDDIRTAYRERKSELDTSTDDGKDEAALLNKAWNVLSDPYQRGRYDAELEAGYDDEYDDDEYEDDDEEVEVASNGKGRPARSRPAATKKPPPRNPRNPRELPPPTIQPPAGTHYPQQKQRIVAMVIDLAVLLVFFIGFSFAGNAIARSQHPQAAKDYDHYSKQVTGDDQKAIDQAQKDLDNAKKGTDAAATQSAQQKLDQAKQTQKDDQKKLDDAQGELAPMQNVFVGLAFLAALIYLVVPSVITGRTMGKRFQHLKVVREDGSKLRAGDAIKRYGAIVLVTYAGTVVSGGTILTLIIPAAVLYAILRWMRNNNMQGVHDRFAHTIVVADGPN